MQPFDFNDVRRSSLHKIQDDAWAYVPPKLPRDGVMDQAVWIKNSEADRAIGRLAGLGENLRNPHLLIRPFIRREAVESSQIEGTQAEQQDLVLFEVDPEEPTTFDVQEVRNYVKALDYGLDRLNDLPVAQRLIKEMHRELMTGVRGGDQSPGEYRRVQNWIGTPGCTIAEATYVPPPVPKMIDALGELEKFIHKPPTGLPPLVRLAMIHYQFEAIHPFMDGNGRIGRLLLSLLLCVEKILPQPLLYLSAYFNRHRTAYYRLLLDVSTNNNWTDWILFFLQGVIDQASDAIDCSRRLTSLHQEFTEKLQAEDHSATVFRLLDQLFIRPGTTGALVALDLEVSPKTAYNTIEKMVAANILYEVTGKKRNKIYLARPILQAANKG
ncbi:MAG: Fic family protein [Planctomycetota bacterium]